LPDEEKLSILLVPIGYKSENHDDWVDRAAAEAKKIAETPPFCRSPSLTEDFPAQCNAHYFDNPNYPGYGTVGYYMGAPWYSYVRISRLDGSYVNKEVEECLIAAANSPNPKGATATCFNMQNTPTNPENGGSKVFENFCGGNTQVVYVNNVDTVGKIDDVPYYGFADKILYSVISKSPSNIIVHELGHSFCGLSDEYTGLSNAPEISDSINCDYSPAYCEDPASDEKCRLFNPQYFSGMDELGDCLKDPGCANDKIICKWDKRHPQHEEYLALWEEKGITFPEEQLKDAGCIPGCGGRENAFRPKKDLKYSMMNSPSYGAVISGATDNNRGTWNKVSYAWCKGIIDNIRSSKSR
jgi:hypothetical protein